MPRSDRVDHTSEGFKDFFATDLATIQKRIDSSDRYRDLIQAEVIQKINQKVHTMPYEEFVWYITGEVSLDDIEFRALAMYQNIYYEDPRMTELIELFNRNEEYIDDDDVIYYGHQVTYNYRSNAEIAGIISVDDYWFYPRMCFNVRFLCLRGRERVRLLDFLPPNHLGRIPGLAIISIHVLVTPWLVSGSGMGITVPLGKFSRANGFNTLVIIIS